MSISRFEYKKLSEAEKFHSNIWKNMNDPGNKDDFTMTKGRYIL